MSQVNFLLGVVNLGSDILIDWCLVSYESRRLVQFRTSITGGYALFIPLSCSCIPKEITARLLMSIYHRLMVELKVIAEMVDLALCIIYVLQNIELICETKGTKHAGHIRN